MGGMLNCRVNLIDDENKATKFEDKEKNFPIANFFDWTSSVNRLNKNKKNLKKKRTVHQGRSSRGRERTAKFSAYCSKKKIKKYRNI